jgi:neutral amino acid transport system permease protein
VEAQSISAPVDLPLRERLRETAPVRLAGRYPQYTATAVIALGMLILIARHGIHEVAQTSLNGLTLGSVYALGAVGLTLVYGILKLTNFAHGDFLTFGAYMAFLVNVTWSGPLVLGIVFGMLATALLAVFLEKIMWGPMRARHAGLLHNTVAKSPDFPRY